MRKTIEERFWSKVHQHRREDCWLWQGSKNGRDYGGLKQNGKMRLAHRVVWELTYGPIPNGFCVLHHCDNPPCVNPAHLFLGTHLDNMRDMGQKGRAIYVRGETHGLSKLSSIQVLQMRSLREQGWSYPRLGKEFGVSHKTARKAVIGITWAHI